MVFATYIMKSSKKNISRSLDLIKKALKEFEDGSSLEQIKARSGLDLELRTLQRRLEKLIHQGFVTTSGGSKSLRYHLVKAGTAEKDKGATSFLLPLSPESKNILALISNPEQARNPVGYNRNFLDAYQPNIDSFLTAQEKEKLTESGKTARLNDAAGTYAKEILHRLLIDLSWNSSRLEGNTYSLLDTERLISFGRAADDKSATEAQMILNHKDAIEFLVQGGDDIGFNRYTIRNLHALLSNNLLPDPAAPGRLRSHGVGIERSVYTPLSVPQLIEEMFEQLLEKAGQIQDPFEQAFFIMVHLPYLQPFEDVNKRVSRLAANISLNRHNLTPLSFIDVPNDLYIHGLLGVYELNRIELLKDVFLWAYERSSARYAALRQSLGEPDPFRLKYRVPIYALIAEIVSTGSVQKEAIAMIKNKALEIPENDQPKFIESVETELLSLHEGNFARYRISPSQFKQWKEKWDIK